MTETATTPAGTDLPLTGVRVLDLTDGRGGMCGRLLADLGADVLLVEPPGGAGARTADPVVDGAGLQFTVHSANKRSATLDWTTSDGRERLLRLVDTAHILVESAAPGRLAGAGLGVDVLLRRNPRLVVSSITDFGQTGPYRDWAATDWVHLALSSVLSRSGLPGRAPLLPPGRLADETASVQAAWATLVAYWDAQARGVGEHVDVSVLETTLQTLDPPFGIAGSATGGVPDANLPPGRPDAGFRYPILPCGDGYVRLCVLSPRQWQAMFAWLGEPAEFADPKYDVLSERFAAWDRLGPVVEAMFRGRSRSDLVADGQRRGIPIESVRDAGEVLTDAHFAARDVWLDLPVGGGPHRRTGRVSRGFLELDGERIGIRAAAPEPGADSDGWRGPAPSFADRGQPPADAQRGPLSGLRVLDLGVIVVGAETGRLFADQGADVIKIESRQFPDGSRQSRPGVPISATFAWGHRNKRSLGLDLRTPEGRDLFLRLVEVSDVVLSNFKPGTLESLGLDDAALRQANPGVVVVDSSALGRKGPDSRRMGYGPLVRAATGLTGLWRYPDQTDGFCDAVTVYPDHSAARVGAVGALAALLRRRRTGRGGRIDVAQAEVMLTQFGAELLRESLEPGTLRPRGNVGEFDAPYSLYPCAGDDEWCIVTVRGNDDWRRLCAVVEADDLASDPELGTPAGRAARRDRIDARVAEWSRQHPPHEAMRRLQEAGVPAGAMNRVSDLRLDPQIRSRRFFTALRQPSLGDIPAESGPAHFGRIAEPRGHPAPLQGEHTRIVCAQLLGLPESEFDKLADQGVLQAAEPGDE